MSFDTDYYNGLELGALLIALVGSINWLAVGLADYNLVTDLLGLTDPAIVYVVVGLAGLVVVADLALDTEILDQ